ncbi:MAG: hypothetical protein AAFP99_05880 [Pseudomonadota bacterium]
MKRLWIGLAMCAALTACTTTKDASDSDVSAAAYKQKPSGVKQDGVAPDVDALLGCIASTGRLSGQRFAVGPYNNETGKSNSVSDGATGSFLPVGGNFSVYAMEAIARAGGEAYDYANLDVVKNIAVIGGKNAVSALQARQNAAQPQYVVNVFATALDFKGAQRGDFRVAGVGPTYTFTGARAHYAAHIVEPGSQRSLARGYALYDASYSEVGVGIGRFFGGGTGTLVTGNISFANQQPLQRPTAEGIMLSVAYALLDVPGLQGCRSLIGGSGAPS